MKLVSKDGGIAAVSLVPDEVRPLQGFYLPDFFLKIAERYSLVKQPSLDEARQSGAKFRTGRFSAEGREIAIAELAIFNDGLGATTTDTADSELVVADLFGWLKETCGFRDPITKTMRWYQSDLVVDFENNVESVLGIFLPVLQTVQKEIEAVNGVKKTFHFNTLGFVSEAFSPGPIPEFLVERRIGAPINSKRYFSKAHISTAAHIRVLETLDTLIGKSGK